MTKIQIKRVYEPEEQSDGFRVLVDRLWPRGIKKENLHYDYWDKEITPSVRLRQWFHQDQDKNWMEFKHRYILELSENPEVEHLLKIIKDKEKVTLLYAARNTEKNHAVILQGYLSKQPLVNL